MDAGDRELLSRWSNERDADAFHEIVDRHAGMVYGACLRILRNPEEAEDVSQDCFLSLATAPTSVRSSVGGWLHQLATHHALNRLRGSKRRKAREGRFAMVNGMRVEPDWDDTKGYVDEAIAALPEKYRIIVISHFLESQTYEAIAAVQGVPRSTIASRDRRREHISTTIYPQTATVNIYLPRVGDGCTPPESIPAPPAKIRRKIGLD